MSDEICYRPIGFIRTPFQTTGGMPIQPAGAENIIGIVEIDPRHEAGLADLDGFSHVILIYAFHQVTGYSLSVTPFLDDTPRGLFATRAPRRPNPIGLSVVRLLEVTGCTLRVQGVDILDGTPLLDLKPFLPEFDAPTVERIGWLQPQSGRVRGMRADDRFRS